MKSLHPFRSLQAKTMAWLCLHLMLLASLFWLFVTWQLGLGLDSLLSGSAGARLTALAVELRDGLADKTVSSWHDAIHAKLAERGLQGRLITGRDLRERPLALPANVALRIRETLPPGAMGRPGGPPPGRPGGPRGWPTATAESGSAFPAAPQPKPLFLLRGDGGDGYWAGVLLPLRTDPAFPHRPAMLLIRSDSPAGQGLFFDVRPWLWGGVTVLLVSLLFWWPAVWRISRYLRRLTHAAESIAAGNFQVSAAPHPQDELGQLGTSIESMAAQLDQLVGGQKRFLQNAAHELCAPLARLRTGLAVAEAGLPPTLLPAWQAIDQDAAELAELVDEILSFSRSGRLTPHAEAVDLITLLKACTAREAATLQLLWDVPETAVARVDASLFTRAIANVMRNAVRHAGATARLEIVVRNIGSKWEITCSDDGPGVPDNELHRLFEPFYRADQSRSRETGGFGLGLSIVKVCLDACGGSATASPSRWGGLSITMRVPVA